MILIKGAKKIEAIQTELEKILCQNALGLFLEDLINEPFGYRYTNHIAFSIADNAQCNNCEMLLLPDGSSLNGNVNPVPFSKRMRIFRDIALLLQAHGCSTELFLGLSGTEYSEYTEFRCSAEEVDRVLAVNYYLCDEWRERDMHIIIS